MARKNHNYERNKNPFIMILYIVTVLVLLCCIGFFILRARKQSAEYQEKVKQFQNREENMISSQEKETEVKTLLDILNETESVPTGTETELVTEAPTESESETESIDYDIDIVILNGTGTQGVAGYWKSELEKEGYTNIVSASYGRKSEEKTFIISDAKEKAEPFSANFQNAQIRIGDLEDRTDIETADGIELPEKVDVWIIVGKEDANKE